VSGEPFPNLANSKFSLADGVEYEFVCSYRLQVKVIAVHAEKCVGYGQADSLVAVEESVVVRERLHEGCGFVDEVVVVAILGTKDGRFEEAPVAKTMDAAKFINELTMHLDGFANGQVDVARRDIPFRGHGIYFARR
jgi:hypothetical protein